jgi:two-component system, cell cycle sensor histidine kinase and response regulator CckA
MIDSPQTGGWPAEIDEVDELVRKRFQMEAVSAIAGRMAHELNNLFTLVSGSVWRIEEVVQGSGDEASREVASLRRSMEAASGLTRNLLAYSRQQVLEPRVTDLNALVGDLVPSIEDVTGAGVEIMVLSEPGLATALVDAAQLEDALFSIAENAGAAMPAGGLLTIEVSDAVLEMQDVDRYAYPVESGRYVRLTISDTGMGMSPEQRERAFEPFFTTHATEGHFGLGLSSAYGFIKQSGGYIWIDSEEGVGTSVSIYLPFAAGEPAKLMAPTELPALRAGGPATILVVEDNPGVRSMVVRLLMRRGFSVVEAADGLEALGIAESYPSEINLLLTDVMMPHMDGRELVEKLRHSRPELRVLYMSGYAQKASMRTHYISSSDAFVAKPFDPGVLVEKVLETLSVVPAQRDDTRSGR